MIQIADNSVLPGLGMTELTGWVTAFFFLSLRLGAFILASPSFGGRFVPLPVRIVATMVITLSLVGQVEVPQASALADLSAVPFIMNELMLGLSAGLVITIMFSAASLAGDRIANTAGLGFAAQFDPTSGGQTPVLAQIFSLFLLMIFIGTDSHLTAFRILLDSYETVPPGTLIAPERYVWAGIQAGGDLFVIGMKIMLPVIAALLLLNMTIGVITRSAPQLNIFSFGFPLTMTATFILLYLTVPGAGRALEDLVNASIDLIVAMFKGIANG